MEDLLKCQMALLSADSVCQFQYDAELDNWNASRMLLIADKKKHSSREGMKK